MVVLIFRSLFGQNVLEKHEAKRLVGTGNFYGCGKSGHMKRDFPMIKAQGKENAQAQAISPNPNFPKKNHFYILQSLGDQENSPDVITAMFQVFSINNYSLSDSGATFYFVTLLVSIKSDMFTDVIDALFSV